MSTLWAKLRPHLSAWHVLPCLVMLVAAIGVAIATGQPSRVRGHRRVHGDDDGDDGGDGRP